MTAQQGALLLVKIGNGATPTETFTPLGGLRATRITLSNQVLDASTLASGAWRSLLASAGIRSLVIAATGLFTDSASEESLRSLAFSGASRNYKITFGNGDTIAGAFIVSDYERSGNHDAEELYSLTLQSSGIVTFTAG